MDLDINPGDELKILRDIRGLLWDVILPRLDTLEGQVQLLREVTWPVCQSLKEAHTLDDLENKRKFLKDGVNDADEAMRLLAKKWKLDAMRHVEFSGCANKNEEFTNTVWRSPLDRPRPYREPAHQTSDPAATQ